MSCGADARITAPTDYFAQVFMAARRRMFVAKFLMLMVYSESNEAGNNSY